MLMLERPLSHYWTSPLTVITNRLLIDLAYHKPGLKYLFFKDIEGAQEFIKLILDLFM